MPIKIAIVEDNRDLLASFAALLNDSPGMACVGAYPTAEQAVLMLTRFEQSDLIFNSIRAGASGYLLKSTTPDELILAVEQVRAGGAPMSMQIARKVVDHFHQIRKPASEVERLTPREQELLKALADGFSYKEIAGRLDISIHTVRTHLQHIYEKLHVQSRTLAVLKFLGR